MLKTLAAIGLATSIGFTPIVFAPMAAMAQPSAAKPPHKVTETKAAQCAKEVEAKGLRGKPAKKFRSECEKNLR
jgi:hypothetical protein